MEETIQLSTLLDHLLQKSYGDLTKLAELLPRKTDLDRKLDIVRYTRQTRQLLIRFLALVKWTRTSDPVRQCAEVSSQIGHQSWVFVDTADQLAHLSRTLLQQAAMPNLSLAPAIDVMTTGSYPRLPTCIQDRIIPPASLSASEKKLAFELLEEVIRFSLTREHLPECMRVTSINKGRVTLTVPYEFEVVLTVVGDDMNLPWRLLDVRILVGNALPGSPVLITEQQRYYLHQLVQSHLCAEEGSLCDLFNILHHFCLSLQLDCLHSQVERLSMAVCGIYMKVEEYVPGQHVRLAYWRSTGPTFLFNESNSPWPRITLSIRPYSNDKPLLTTHHPPLPLNAELSLQPNNLSLQDLLVQCIRVRSLAFLKDLQETFVNTSWENHVHLVPDPPCLAVTLSSSLATDVLLLSIDIRMGQIVASLEDVVKPSNEQILKTLQQIEKEAMGNKHLLPLLLGHLLCELYLTHVATLTTNCGISHTYSLPLLMRLPNASRTLFLKLNEGTYFVLGTQWKDGGLCNNYHLLRVVPSAIIPTTPNEEIPKAFLKTEVLIDIDAKMAFDHLSGSITVNQSSAKLKRKLQERTLLLPSAKRLCLYPSLSLPPLAGLLATQDALAELQASLSAVGISASAKMIDVLGTPCLKLFSIESTSGRTQGDSLLSSLLLSYELWPHPHDVQCKVVFRNILKPSPSPIVIKRRLRLKNIGELIRQDWSDKSTLLMETLELQHYLNEGYGPFKLCSIKSYNYDNLTVQYGEHIVNLHAQGEGVVINCPPTSPHYYMTSTLQQYLHKTKSLPLLVQGLCLTRIALSKLASGFKNTFGYQIAGITPSYLRLTRGNVSLNIRLLPEGGVSFCGVTCQKDSMPPIVTQPTLLRIVQSFLELQLTGKLPDDLIDEPQLSLPSSGIRSSLNHSLLPLPSPRLASPLPSIPSLPPPGSELPPAGEISLEVPIWERSVTMAQLNTLIEASHEGLNPLERFIGSLSLLLHWVKEASQDRYLQQQMIFLSVDRGVFSYKTETLTLSLSLDLSTMMSLHLSAKPVQENIWTQSELQLLTDFFHRHVVKSPFSFPAMSAFMQLFWIPLRTLKACVHIMQLQMHHSPDTIWRVEYCLVVPKGVDLGDIARAGSPGIIYRGKVLLFLNLIRQADQVQVTLPILHDPKNNGNFVARRTSSSRVELPSTLQSIDQILRKPQNSETTASHNESSLAQCISHLITLNLPV